MKTLRLALVLIPIALLAGCAGYQRGPLPDSKPASVYLEPIQNEAYISGFAPLFQNELRKAILNSRLLILSDDPEDADMIAYIRLRDFDEEPIGFLESDTGQPISARVQISAILSLWDSPLKDVSLVENEVVRVDSAVYSSPQTAFTAPVDQSKPAIARNLAAKTTLEMELKRP